MVPRLPTLARRADGEAMSDLLRFSGATAPGYIVVLFAAVLTLWLVAAAVYVWEQRQ